MPENENLQKQRVLAPDNEELELLKLSEKAERQSERWWAKRNMARAHYLGKKAMKLVPLECCGDQDHHYCDESKEYYRCCDELAKLCQSVFRDAASTRKALDYLLEIYDLLITNTTAELCNKYTTGRVNPDFEEWKGYAQSIFCRLITGDTPEKIRVFAEQEPNTFETKQELYDIKTRQRKKSAKKHFENLLSAIKGGVRPDDYKFAKKLLKDELEDFPKWVNQPTLDFGSWIRSRLAYRLNVCKAGLEITESNEWRMYYLVAIPQLRRLLSNKKTFARFIKRNEGLLKKDYKDYCGDAYKNERFDFSCGKTLTMFISEWLPWRLDDLWESKEHKRKIKDSIKTCSFDEWMVATTDAEPFFDDSQEKISRFYSTLTSRERDILNMKSERPDIKQKEIAEALGVDKSYVSQVMKSIRERATEFFDNSPII